MNNEELPFGVHSTETRPVRKEFTQDELHHMRDEFVNQDLSISAAEDELKMYMKAAKDRIKEMKAQQKDLRKLIRDRFIEEMKLLHLVPDYQAGIMNYMDPKTQEVVHFRKLQPGERQLSIVESKVS